MKIQIEDDATINIEERIGKAAVLLGEVLRCPTCKHHWQKRGIAHVTPEAFWNMSKRLNAKTNWSPYGCWVDLITTFGTVSVMHDESVVAPGFVEAT